jgi:hypothetical protein
MKNVQATGEAFSFQRRTYPALQQNIKEDWALVAGEYLYFSFHQTFKAASTKVSKDHLQKKLLVTC